MKTRLILAICLLTFSLQQSNAQGGIFGSFEKAWGDVSEAFTGDKAEAAEAKAKADHQKAVEAEKARYAAEKAAQKAAQDEHQAVHAIDANGENQLMRAVRAGDSDVSKDLIKRGANARLVNQRGSSVLHEAVRSDNATVVDVIIVNGGNVNAQDGNGKTPMDIAMQFPNKEVVEKLVMNNATITPQHIARVIQLDEQQVLETLLQNGGNPEYALVLALERNKNDLFTDIMTRYDVKIDNSVFNFAIDKRNFEIAENLLSSSINPNQALDYAISKNAKQIIEPTLNAGADANKALTYAVSKRDQQLAETCIMMFNADPNPHLKTAIDKNNMPMVDMLIMNGADANQGLATAVSKNNIVMVRKLLDADADPTAQMANAATAGRDQMVQAMIDKGGDVNKGALPAAKAGKYNTAKLLVDNGADADPILPLAVKGKNLPLVTACISAGADVNLGIKPAIDNGDARIAIVLLEAPGADATPEGYIIKAVELENKVLVSKLLELGADPNNGMKTCIEKNNETILTQLLEKGADGTNPMFIKKSCTTGNVSITKQLIAAGADASSVDLLIPSVKHNNPALTALLFENGADVQAAVKPAVEANAHQIVKQVGDAGVDLTEPGLLNTAVSRKYSQTVGVLLGAGSDPNLPTVNGSGFKMIHIAAQNKDLATANMLIQYKADVTEVASSTGDTPLHVLAMQKNPGKNGGALAEALILAGADVNARNGKDELVFQVCRAGKVKRVLKKNKALTK